MDMKKFRRRIWPAVLCLLALCLAACGNDQPGTDGRPEVTPDLLSHQPQSSVTVYYLAADADVLVPVVYGINSSRDTIWVALDKLLAGPADGFCRAVVPQGIKMKDLYYANDTVHISLTGDGELTAADINAEAIFATVNNELVEQNNKMTAVQVYYDDKPLFDEPYYREAVNDFGGGAEGSYVYFTDSQAMYVVPLRLPVLRDDHPEFKDYLHALMSCWTSAPPEHSGLYSVMPQDILVNYVRLEDGLLTIDFNEALLEISGSAQEKLFTDTLLATFFRIDEVQTVSFSVNGKPLAELAQDSNLSEPLAVPHGDFLFNMVNQ